MPARSKEGPALCLADGVTACRCGLAGGRSHRRDVAVAKAAPQPGRVLINIGRAGILPEGDTDGPQPRRCRRGARAPSSGIATSSSASRRGCRENVAGENDLEVLRRAQEVAGPLRIAGHDPHGSDRIAAARHPRAAQAGRHRHAHVCAAAERHLRRAGQTAACRSARCAQARHLVRLRQRPRRITSRGTSSSTRWPSASRPTRSRPTGAAGADRPGRSTSPNVMSKFLVLGMPLDHVIACATVNAAKTLPAFKRRGTLAVGAPADVAILELAAGHVRIRRQLQGEAHRYPAPVCDEDGLRRQGLKALRLAAAPLLGGRRVFRQQQTLTQARYLSV